MSAALFPRHRTCEGEGKKTYKFCAAYIPHSLLFGDYEEVIRQNWPLLSDYCLVTLPRSSQENHISKPFDYRIEVVAERLVILKLSEKSFGFTDCLIEVINLKLK